MPHSISRRLLFGLEAMFQSFGFDFVMPLFHALVMACSFKLPIFFFRFVSDGFVLMASKALLCAMFVLHFCFNMFCGFRDDVCW